MIFVTREDNTMKTLHDQIHTKVHVKNCKIQKYKTSYSRISQTITSH